MGYYARHVFVCVNARDGGKPCCAAGGSEEAREHIKARLRSAGVNGPGRVRVSGAGCLGRCARGPVLVVYPEGVWYTFAGRRDLDAIVDRHLIGGETVAELQLDDG